MAISIRDIARAAGVSRSTVSRALTDSPLVNSCTKARIRQLAEEMGYMPNVIARGLTTRRTYTFGIIVLDLADPYIAELVDAIGKAAQKVNYRLLLSPGGPDADGLLRGIKMLFEQRVDAIIVPEATLYDEYLPLLSAREIPVAVIDRRNQPNAVGTDNVEAAKVGVNYLLDLGHERIAYISSVTVRGNPPGRERQAGYEQALLERGISPDPSFIVTSDVWSPLEGGRIGAKKLLDLPQLPTAVFCWNDRTAIGAVGEFCAAGLRVPDDISVLGFDDIDLAAYLNPPLTTIAQHKERLAQLAVEIALRLIAGSVPESPATLPGKLIIRQSTAPPLKRP